MLGLKKGDIIDVVAPSCGDLEVSVNQVKEFIRSLGYEPRVPEDLQEKDADLFSANTHEVRSKHLIDALKAKDSKVIWMFRGGYGATKLIPELDKHDFSSNPKTLIGFSDITALGIYFGSKYNWPFIHGRMLSSYVKNEQSEKEFDIIKGFISGDWNNVKYDLRPYNAAAREDICIESQIAGGNLALIQCSLGTSWQIKTNNKILFIEEVSERGYSIDRMLEHLMQAGCLNDITALIIGDIKYSPKKEGELLCNPAFERMMKLLGVPVFQSNDFGHGKINYPLIFNSDMKIIGGKSPTLVFENDIS
ncbi:MAG: LD-carboxypeptidase [Alphaproteobacteria bacterium]|nr:LD-carboxypeptidase [Alphaproteobacteria bacterium]